MYEVRQHCHNVPELVRYSDSLVPRLLRHDKRIINNQRYYVALFVRNIRSIQYSNRKELYEGLLEGVSISGLANEVYDLEDLLTAIDINKLADYINRGG